MDSQPLLKHPTFFFVLVIALKQQEGIAAWKQKSHSGALTGGLKLPFPFHMVNLAFCDIAIQEHNEFEPLFVVVF